VDPTKSGPNKKVDPTLLYNIKKKVDPKVYQPFTIEGTALKCIEL